MSSSVRSGRHALRAATVVLLALVLTACEGQWGIRSSYRNYVASPIGGGEITPIEGAGWEDGPGAGKGPFLWSQEWAEFDEATETGTVQLSGGVETRAHQAADGLWLLDTTFRNPRLEIDGDEGILYVDLNYRPFTGTDPDPIPTLRAAVGVPFATVDLSAVTWTQSDSGYYTISSAPAVGVQSTMEMIGWDLFYGDPVTLDPLTINFRIEAATLADTAQITVSATEGLDAGDQITVWGTGFDPAAHVGTRPPLAGQQSGVYAVFGRFGDTWRPSLGAPSSSRRVISQKWALPAASRAVLDPTGTGTDYVTIDAAGNFAAVVTVGVDDTVTGNYGVYTYPGSGAVDGTQEVAQLVTLG